MGVRVSASATAHLGPRYPDLSSVQTSRYFLSSGLFGPLFPGLSSDILLGWD